MGVRPVSIVRRLDDRRIRRGQCVYGLPLNDIFSADGQSLRELRRDFPCRRGSVRKLGDSRLAHPPHSAQHRNRRARQLWRTGTMRCGDRSSRPNRRVGRWRAGRLRGRPGGGRRKDGVYTVPLLRLLQIA